MKIYRLLLLAFFLSFNLICRAQASFNVNLRVGDRHVSINAIEIDDQMIFLDRTGNIRIESNNDVDYDYYDRFAGNEAGKLKSVNGLVIKYYDRFDRDELRGKIKSIGTVKFTYYDVLMMICLGGSLKP